MNRIHIWKHFQKWLKWEQRNWAKIHTCGRIQSNFTKFAITSQQVNAVFRKFVGLFCSNSRWHWKRDQKIRAETCTCSRIQPKSTKTAITSQQLNTTFQKLVVLFRSNSRWQWKRDPKNQAKTHTCGRNPTKIHQNCNNFTTAERSLLKIRKPIL